MDWVCISLWHLDHNLFLDSFCINKYIFVVWIILLVWNHFTIQNWSYLTDCFVLHSLQSYWKNRSEFPARCQSKLPVSSRDSSTRYARVKQKNGCLLPALENHFMTAVVGLCCHLSLVFIFHPPFVPSHLSTKPHYYHPRTNFHSHHAFSARSLLCYPLHLPSCSPTFLLTPPAITAHSFSPFSHLYSLPQDPKERLGCHPQTGFADIMGHPFFRNVDWDLVSHSFFFFFLLPFIPRLSTSSWLSSWAQMEKKITTCRSKRIHLLILCGAKGAKLLLDCGRSTRSALGLPPSPALRPQRLCRSRMSRPLVGSGQETDSSTNG